MTLKGILGRRGSKGERRYLLEWASFAYIFFPCILFALGWLRPIVFVPVFALLVFGVYSSMEHLRRSRPEDDSKEDTPQPARYTRLKYASLAVIVVSIVICSGIGGYTFQNSDFNKHNSFLKDLTLKPWPLVYEKSGPNDESGPVLSYVAVYLPAAFVGKLFGWSAANHFLAAWVSMGVMLVVLWFLRLVGRVSVLIALLFLFYGGLDIVGYVAVNSHYYQDKENGNVDRSDNVLNFWLLYHALDKKFPLNRWNDAYQTDDALNGLGWFYQSNIVSLYWSFHHILPGWIIMLMLMYYSIYLNSSESVLFLYAASPVGSVFCALGMIPYVIVSLFQTRLRNVFSFQNVVVAPLLLLVMGLYYLSNQDRSPAGWLWEFQNLRVTWPYLLLFYAVAFGAYVAACPVLLSESGQIGHRMRVWWWTAIACLLFLPLYRLGVYNELESKGSLPSLLALQVYLFATIGAARTVSQRNSVRLLVFLLLIGTFASVNEVCKGLNGQFSSSPPSVESTPSINNAKIGFPALGDENSLFWRYLAKPLSVPLPSLVWDLKEDKAGYQELVFSQSALNTMSRSGFHLILDEKSAIAAVDASTIAGVRVTMMATVSRDVLVPLSRAGIQWARTSDPEGDESAQQFTPERSKEMFPEKDDPTVWWADCRNLASWNGEIRDMLVYFDLPEVTLHEWEYLHVRLEKVEFMRMPQALPHASGP